MVEANDNPAANQAQDADELLAQQFAQDEGVSQMQIQTNFATDNTATASSSNMAYQSLNMTDQSFNMPVSRYYSAAEMMTEWKRVGVKAFIQYMEICKEDAVPIEPEESKEPQDTNQTQDDVPDYYKCIICQQELYDYKKTSAMTDDEIERQDELDECIDPNRIPVVQLGHCNGLHFYHARCLNSQITPGQFHFSCRANGCGRMYGLYLGNGPSGYMQTTKIAS